MRTYRPRKKNITIETKQTKADIYRAHGITYKNGRVLLPISGHYFTAPLLKTGNTKVCTPAKELTPEDAKEIKAATFGICHGCETFTIEEVSETVRILMSKIGITEFIGSCPCHCAGCYVDSGNYNFPDNVAGRQIRLLLAKYFPEWTEAAIMAQIDADGIKQIRIHDAGDFFSVAYLNMWIRIIRTNRNVTFWTYTKNDAAKAAFDAEPNAFITPSITPEGINYGTCEYILKLYKHLTAAGYRVKICACGTPYEQHCDRCNMGCKRIGIDTDYVLFIMHSVKGYKAGKTDPEAYAQVLEIIRRQNAA